MKSSSAGWGPQWLLKMSPDKQDTLLKMLVLSIAAILCKLFKLVCSKRISSHKPSLSVVNLKFRLSISSKTNLSAQILNWTKYFVCKIYAVYNIFQKIYLNMQFIVDLICIQCPSVQHLKIEIMKHLKAHFENIFLSAFSTRLFSVLRFESVIHEFDPYFNYRTTRYLTEEGFYSFHNWFDDRAWYPLGRIIGGTIYPGEKLNDIT